MLKALRVRLSQGRQFVPDLRAARPRGYRGLPVIGDAPCDPGCRACLDACPAAALELEPVRLDLGRCILCGECAALCGPGKLAFSGEHRLAAADRADLTVSAAVPGPPAVAVAEALRALFGRSLRLRSVSSGGCSACELELNALGNVNFDLGRHGIEFVASPRHADALVLSGPLTRNMEEALELAWAAMPAPRFVIAFGACAISGGPYQGSEALARGFLERNRPALWLPGCPPHPLTFVNGILDLLGIALPASPAGQGWVHPEPLPGRRGFPRETIEARRDAAERLLVAVGCDPG